MHYPYLALIWDATEAAATATAKRLIDEFSRSRPYWIPRIMGSGAAVFDTSPPPGPMAVHPFANRAGVLYGRLFRRDTYEPLSASFLEKDDEFAQSCITSRGDCLRRDYWGAYVTIFTDPSAPGWRVVRDCSGMMPCFYTTFSGVTLVFSDIGDLDGLEIRFSIDWDYVIGFLAQPQLEIRETGLQEVRELLAGEAISIVRGRAVSHFAWDPASIFALEPIVDEEEACLAIRETNQACTNAWASTCSRILHSLSGGFDSAVVLGALMCAPVRPEVVCINRFAAGAAEDERRYARAAARHCGMELLEVPWEGGTRELGEHCLRAPAGPKPAVPHLVGFLESPFWNEICAARGCQAVWTGQGGDHLFLSARNAHGIVDCLRIPRCRKQLPSAVWDAAVLTGQSVWHVVGSAAAAAFDGRRFEREARLPIRPQLLRPEAHPVRLEEYTTHPWWPASRALPPGKRFQILLLADVLNRHRPMPGVRSTEELHPLLCQPLVETCLRIPLHVLLRRGKTRALARRAFASNVPAEILAREAKGETSTYTLGLLRRSKPFVTELLLDGLLVRHGAVSRHAVAALLTEDEPIRSDSIFSLLACLTAEVWMRAWAQRTTCAPKSRLATAITADDALASGTDTIQERVRIG